MLLLDLGILHIYLNLRPLKPIMGLEKCENLHIIFAYLYIFTYSATFLHICIYISHIFFAYFMVYTV